MNPEGHTTFQPNRLVLEAAHRAAVDCFGALTGFRLSLRPARRYLFPEPPEVRSLQVELRKPAFAALIREGDPEARVQLVIETEPISPGIRALYRAAGLPVVTVKCRLGVCQFIYERDGFYADLRPSEPLLDQTVHFLVGCAECTRQHGSLAPTSTEQMLARCIEESAKALDCSVHYQVPFGYTVGYRPDLPGRAARQTIQLLLALNPRQSPSGEVVLPVRVETRPVKERDAEELELDEEIANFVVKAGIPMVAAERVGPGEFTVTCSMDGMEERVITEDDVQGWARYFEMACEAATKKIRSVLQNPQTQHSG